jgi:hypothetical protein
MISLVSTPKSFAKPSFNLNQAMADETLRVLTILG